MVGKMKKQKINNIERIGNNFFELTKSIIVYKQVKVITKTSTQYAVATLEIPRGATVYLTISKCRASSAIVKSIRLINSSTLFKSARSLYDNSFMYRVGKKVKPLKKFSYKHNECESGIHFFRNCFEAEALFFVVQKIQL